MDDIKILTVEDIENMLAKLKDDFNYTLENENHKSARLYELSGTMRNLVDIQNKLAR